MSFLKVSFSDHRGSSLDASQQPYNSSLPLLRNHKKKKLTTFSDDHLFPATTMPAFIFIALKSKLHIFLIPTNYTLLFFLICRSVKVKENDQNFTKRNDKVDE
jgi:hypothetical protein